MEAADQKLIEEILLEECPEAGRLPKPILTALVEGIPVTENSPGGLKIEFNQDWAQIISDVQTIVGTISTLVSICVAWQKLRGKRPTEAEVFDKLKKDKHVQRAVETLGEKKTRDLIQKVVRER